MQTFPSNRIFSKEFNKFVPSSFRPIQPWQKTARLEIMKILHSISNLEQKWPKSALKLDLYDGYTCPSSSLPYTLTLAIDRHSKVYRLLLIIQNTAVSQQNFLLSMYMLGDKWSGAGCGGVWQGNRSATDRNYCFCKLLHCSAPPQLYQHTTKNKILKKQSEIPTMCLVWKQSIQKMLRWHALSISHSSWENFLFST